MSTTSVVRPDDLVWYKVVLTHPNHHSKVVFRSVDQGRARRFIENRFPRGSEAHLVLPNGETEHYERERSGELGIDLPPWASFDPSTWIPPDTQQPPGETAWSDKEG